MHKCVDVNEVDAALIKAAQVFPVKPDIKVCLFCLQPPFFNTTSSPKTVYDVPTAARKMSLYAVSS